MSSSHGEESDCHSDHHCLRSQDHSSCSCKCHTTSRDIIRNVGEAQQNARDPESKDVSWAEKGSALPAAGLALLGRMVCQESSHCTCSTSWIPWHLFLGTWRVRLHWLVKHEMKVIDEPFKERFWRIPSPMVTYAHVKEMLMLEAGMICPSQSLCCNAVVLVCKKDRGLHFCIDFCKLNVRTKKDS